MATYTIHEKSGNTYQTNDPDVAEEHSRSGLKVTATCP